MWLSDLQYDFRSSHSTADLLTVLSYKIARAFNRSAVTQIVPLDISKLFDKVKHVALLHKLHSYGYTGRFRGLLWSCLDERRLRVVPGGKFLQDYSAGLHSCSPNLFYCT